MRKTKQIFALALALAACVVGVHAADTSPSEPASSWQSQAQKEIKANNYSAAISTLVQTKVSNSHWVICATPATTGQSR